MPHFTHRFLAAGRLTAALSVLVATGASLAHTEAAPPKKGKTQVAAAPTLPPIAALTGYRTAQLEVPAGIPERADIRVSINGTVETLRLFRVSLRTPKATMLLDRGNGVMEETALPPHRTYRGTVASSGARIAASIVDGKLWAMIDIPTGTIFVQPMSDFVAGRTANEHAIYAHSDVVPVDAARCGNDDVNLALPDWMNGLPNDPASGAGVVNGDGGLEMGGEGGEGGVAGTTPFIAEIAFDADFEFFQKNASNAANTINDIELVMNNVAFVYDRDVNISYEFTTFVIRTTAADPYTTTVMNDLLCEFRNKWNTTPENQIQRDVAQLFTGKTITGSVIGLAWLGVMCNQAGTDCAASGNLAYSAVESRFTTTSDFRTSLSAHELGHNWQAGHCDATNPCNIMCSIINSCQGSTGTNLKFNTSEQAQITAFRNAVSCDAVLPAPSALPFIDAFDGNGGFIDATKWIYSKGAATSINATNEPSPTRSLNLDAIGNLEYGDDEIRSNFMLLAGLGTVIVSYSTEAIGVEAGKQLIVEYLNSSLDWTALNTITASGINQTVFTPWQHVLPANAKHNKFRLRFRTAVDAQDDDWYIDSVSVATGTAPSNDECTNAILVGNGTVSFDSFLANGSTLDLPASCNEGTGVTMNADIWYLYIPTCTGTATASTCSTANFDTRLAAYVAACAPSGALIGCDDNTAGCSSNTSTMSFPTTANLPVYIRVGGATGGGTGSLTIACVAPPACPADLDNDGSVGGPDLAALLNAWGTPGADLDADGATGGSDLAALLNSWGLCP